MTYTKHPKTYHLPWSLGVTSDDKILKSTSQFDGLEVVVTEKMDGENTTMYHNHIHARSIDSKHHPSRDWVKRFWSTIQYDIPAGYRICGENVFARHSVAYDNLPSYFLGFGMWHGNKCLNWKITLEWFAFLGITPVKTLYKGVYDEEKIKALWDESKADTMEGYVVRYAGAFELDDYSNQFVGKFVRPGHVQADEHWMHKEIVKNGLNTSSF